MTTYLRVFRMESEDSKSVTTRIIWSMQIAISILYWKL